MPKLFQTVVLAVSAAMLGAGVLLATAQPKEGEKKEEPKPASPAKPADAQHSEPKAVEGVKIDAPTYESPDGKERLPVLSRTEVKVVIEDLKIGTGAEATIESTVSVRYHGLLKDGSVLDSTRKQNNQPYTLPVRRFVQGWQVGIPGMKVGGIRRLSIPYQFAYGDKGQPPQVPPKADLTFTVELVEVK